ncbi:MAG: hypothetical protein NVS3B20_10080 [Polyangiales bacterium]
MYAAIFCCCSLAAVAAPGCATRLERGGLAALCDESAQCRAPLVCKCVVRRSPDAEGPDEIVTHGKCLPVSTKCNRLDAGVPADRQSGLDAGVTDVASGEADGS